MTNKRTPWFIHLIFIPLALTTILPVILVFMVSITDESAILKNGYSFFPKTFSFTAYEYLFNDPSILFSAYGTTIFATVIGTIGSIIITATMAYPLSRPNLPFRKSISFFVFFTILFNGGLVPWYITYSRLFDLRDSIWAFIIPNLLMNGFNIIVMRTFFSNTIPDSLIESAYIDGAGEFRIFAQIIIPLSKPVIATIGLFSALAYWNDWYNNMVFITHSDYINLQFMLNKILRSISFLEHQSGNSNTAILRAKMPRETIRMALAIVVTGPIIFVYPFLQKYFVKGLTIGAVKG